MKKFFVIPVLLVFLFSTQVFSVPINFGDNTIYWAGWPGLGSDNSTDEIGVPIFPNNSAGSYEIVGGKLDKITFNYNLNGYWYENYIKPGDLFIDIGGDSTWDYVVQILGIGTGAGNYNLYSISLSSAGGTSGYVLSDTAWGISGFNIRNRHPVGIDGSVSKVESQIVYFAGWDYGAGNHSTYFDFGDGLDVGSGIFEFSWTVNCANDVVREQGKIPEPTTMILIGAGLLGLGAKFRRRKK
ncbi:MAG: PEP-CTERM sorting domain-containing protein [Thermodesulfobacteriota bacterium]